MSDIKEQLESIKYRLLIIGNQLQLGIIEQEEHDRLVEHLEHELRLLEDFIFSNKD